MELLHHFGLLNNRVQVGIITNHQSIAGNGNIIALDQHNRRVSMGYVVDKARKLNNPGQALVDDMIKQFKKLGYRVETLEVLGQSKRYTYRIGQDMKAVLIKSASFVRMNGNALTA